MLRLEFEPGMREFWEQEHHYVKGNPGTATHLDPQRIGTESETNQRIYREHHRTLFVDEKWKELVTAEQVRRLYALPDVAAESRVLGYTSPCGEVSPLTRAYALLFAATVPTVRRIVRKFRSP